MAEKNLPRLQATMASDKAIHDCKKLKTLHRQSQEAWEIRLATMESSNQQYLIKINELLKEKAE